MPVKMRILPSSKASRADTGVSARTNATGSAGSSTGVKANAH